MSAPVAMHPVRRRRLGSLAFAVMAVVPPVLWALPAGIAARQLGWSPQEAWHLALVLWVAGWLFALPLWRRVGAPYYNRRVGLASEDVGPAPEQPSPAPSGAKGADTTSQRTAAAKKHPRPRAEPEDDDDDDDWPNRRDDDVRYHPESGLRMNGGLDAMGRGYGS